MSATQVGAEPVRLARDHFHLFFDPSQEPAVRVPSGTRLVVETEDPHIGTIRSENDVYHSVWEALERLGGFDPVTGPIYIEGVEPGDCVGLTIEAMVPGPVQGQGYTLLYRGLGGLTSNYSLQPPLGPARTVMCPIRDGKVFLPTNRGAVEISAAPFLGTIGVAPAGERRVTYRQGPEFLGNIDLPLTGVGATVVIRANVPGGLLSFGDPHVVQGDGEISGVAICCQADVTCRVEHIPNEEAQYVALPQVNTTEFIGSIAPLGGVHLGDVVRAAYIDIIHRLVRFHGFDLEDAYMLTSQTGRVHLGNVVDPLYCAAVTIQRKYIE